MTTISAGTTSTTAYVATPDTTGTLVLKTGASDTTALTLDASQNATFAGTLKVNGSTTSLYPLVSGTAVASTSGTSIDFTGIPSTAKRITVMLAGVSTSGTSGLLLQLGDGTVNTTGYISGTSAIGNGSVGSLVTSTAGILATSGLIAAQTLQGSVMFSTINGTAWVAQGSTYLSATATYSVAGTKTLSGVLDRIRITTVNGTDTFDAGTVNIMWE